VQAAPGRGRREAGAEDRRAEGHRQRGAAGEHDERGHRQRLVGDPGEQEDADAGAAAHSVHQSDPVGPEGRARAGRMVRVGWGLPVGVQVDVAAAVVLVLVQVQPVASPAV
jgi:hypothetical protein